MWNLVYSIFKNNKSKPRCNKSFFVYQCRLVIAAHVEKQSDFSKSRFSDSKKRVYFEKMEERNGKAKILKTQYRVIEKIRKQALIFYQVIGM